MSMYGERPTGYIVFAACDSNYFMAHAEALMYSCNRFKKDVHIHIVNPTEEVLAKAGLLNATMPDSKVTYTFNDFELSENYKVDAGALKTYYACLRFLVLPMLLKTATGVLVVDVDCIFMNDFEYPKQDCAYFPRESLPGTTGFEAEGTRVAAGAVYVHSKAMSVATDIVNELNKIEQKWFADQIALSRVFARVRNHTVLHFDSNFMDWDFRDDTVMWTGKGPRKYENKKYLEAKANYEQLECRLKPYDEIMLKPRLDIPFKKFGLEMANTSELPDIRTHWRNFVDRMTSHMRRRGVKPLVVEMPRWTFNNKIQEWLKPEVWTWVPHMEKHNFKGNDRTMYYMQTVFPWYFTVDVEGWGGGAAFVKDFLTDTDTGKYATKRLDELNEYARRRKSKFPQPATTAVLPKGDYIFVPLQLPHDETIMWHSDITVPEFVEAICKWSDLPGTPNIIFKGHPINPMSMTPLQNIIMEYKNAYYLTNANIHDMIDKSMAVYVINSGTGMEAMLRHKKVVAFGRCEYQDAVLEGNIVDLPSVYRRVCEDDIDDRVSLYERWYDWYLNKMCFDTR